MNNPLSNVFGLVQQFKEFKQNFRGDPQQEVQNLLNSGKMTQSQFEQLQQMAMTFKGILF